MKVPTRLSLPVIAGLALAVLAAPLRAATPVRLPGVANHWLANTSGTLEGHIANFLTDMAIYYPNDNQYPKMLVLTGSFWDEGSCGYCSYADGRSYGKAEWWRDTIKSDRAWHGRKKCTIGNFWGRAFLNRNSAPPKGDSAPFVACTDHDTLRSVTDPTAVTFDMQGNLLVADNGPDQNIKIFSMASRAPRLLRTFGDSGGVFAGPVPGKAGLRRFWGIRGVGVDSQGNVYVGNTGIPMQTMGGTDIRAFSGKDSSFLWQVQGLSFTNSADADPASSGRDVYLNAKRFEMDYTKAPGSSWKLSAVTLDPFRYPGDPRIVTPMESVWIRRIQGKKFQYHTNMVGGFVYVARFTDSSEIAIPTAFFSTYQDQTTGWGADSAPTWERNEPNKRLRWYWVDRNGDGVAQKAEFGTWEHWNTLNQGIDVDENGDIWLGGAGKVDTYFKAGGTTRIAAGGLDANGVPRFTIPGVQRYGVPYDENGGSVTRLKHLAAGDVMWLGTGRTSWYTGAIHRYDNYTDTTRRKAVCRVDAGFDDLGQPNINLDKNTAGMTLPWSFTADSDFVYVTYLDNGRYSRKRGEVTIYSAKTCEVIGWIHPGPETGEFAGAVDIVNGINVSTLPDGARTILVEENGSGKIMSYLWCPDGAACKTAGAAKRLRRVQGPEIRRTTTGLEVRTAPGARLELLDLRGNLLASLAASASDQEGWRSLEGTPRGLALVRVTLPDGSSRTGRIPLP